VLQRKNLKVITGEIVTKILIYLENKTAYGVEYVSEREREREREKYQISGTCF